MSLHQVIPLILDFGFAVALGVACGVLGYALSDPLGRAIDLLQARWRTRHLRLVSPVRPLVTIRLRKGVR
jgi:hypothetical protein